MRTLITINFLKINGVIPERKNLNKQKILQSLDVMTEKICNEMLKMFKKNNIEVSIVHVSD